MEWAADYFRVKRITGNVAALRNAYDGNSMKSSEVARSAANKIMIGDWPWHQTEAGRIGRANGTMSEAKSLSVIAFGDTHAEAFKFPQKRFHSFWAQPPDPSFTWW